MARIISFVTLAISILCTVQASCPPAGFDSKQNGFNPIKFFDGRWFSLKQLPVSSQPQDEFYCVNTNYDIERKFFCKIFGCDETVIRVSTASKKGSINGKVKRDNSNGIIKNPALPTQVSIGARFSPSTFYFPYWVVEAGSYSELLAGKLTFRSEQYEWAIISSGAPQNQTKDGCLPLYEYLNPRGLVRLSNPSGVWLYSRQPIVSKEIYFRIEALAAAKGFDISALKTVVQEGCTY